MTDTFPQYFVIDGDIYVKVYMDAGDVVAINHWGNPYPPVKALVDGQPVTAQAYGDAVVNRQGLPVLARAKSAA